MGWLTLLPAIAAIGIALWRKDVFLALPVAIWISETLIAGGNPAQGFLNGVERLATTLGSPGNARLILFCIIVGGLIAVMRRSGGVSALVSRLVDSGAASTPARAGFIAWILGVVLFVETNLSLLGSGVASRGLFDRFKLSRARLAYIIDSTCAPVSVILMFNAWGAFVLSLISEEESVANPMSTLVFGALLNFYAFIAVAMALFVALSGRVHFTLRSHERAVQHSGEEAAEEHDAPTRALFMVAPMAVLIAAIFGFMWWTGEGDLLSGSGSQSVLWAMSLALVVAIGLTVAFRRYSMREATKVSLDGMSELLPAVSIILMALTLSASFRDLGTGAFVASVVSDQTPAILVAPLVFLASAVIAFATGTSWGTFAIMTPIAMPLAAAFGIPPSLVLAGILGGGVFGDHCSPISDTTVIASLASGCDHVEHVRTQLPYALIAAALTTALLIGASVISGAAS